MTASRRPWHVLFLCTSNSARSILAESILNRRGAGKVLAFSAGSRPVGRVHPMALELLQRLGYPTGGLHSKSWEELAGPDAPALDVVLTVCDRAAGEACPVWPGHPVTAHGGVEDPAAPEGSPEAQRGLFAEVYATLERRIERLLALPLGELDPPALKRRLEEIGGLGVRATDPAGSSGPGL